MNTSNDQPYESRKQQSVENLFKFFCNNLYLGQWQLAKASLQQLHRERGATSQPISEVVKDVATYPFNRRCVLSEAWGRGKILLEGWVQIRMIKSGSG